MRMALLPILILELGYSKSILLTVLFEKSITRAGPSSVLRYHTSNNLD
jgi:hypothetical protein